MGQYTELIGIAIALLLMFGSAIANWLKQQREKSEAERRQRERAEQIQLRTQLPRGEQAAPRAASLDTVAAQRREQLRQLALQRQQQGASAPPTRPAQAPEPTNLTMAERIARARAKEQYARRAESMRGQPQSRPAKPQQVRGRPEAQAAAERARQEARARAQMEAERARQETGRQMREQAQRTELEARRRAAVEKEARRRRAAAEVAARPVVAARQAQPSARQTVPAAALNRASSLQNVARPGLGFAFDTRSLRDAFVLKEILDRPLAFREPGGDNAF